MSFDQNMIIDATTGSIARFVNHSCEPNCRMIKWIVSGQPRMALFAGDRPIMTGEELTYDYKFDPFSAKNVQKCLCGSAKCRGVLGPKPKEPKVPKTKESKEALAKSVKKGVSAGKRKLTELLGDKDDEEDGPAKKRKIKSPSKPAPAKKITTSYGAIKAKTAAAALKRSMARLSASTKTAVNTKTTKATKVGKITTASSSPRKRTAPVKKPSVVKTYSKTKVQTKLGGTAVAGSRTSSLTIVAAGASKATTRVASPGPSAKGREVVTTPRKAGRSTKRASDSASPRKGVEIARSATKIKLVRSPTSKTA